MPSVFHYFFSLALKQAPVATISQIVLTWARLIAAYTVVGLCARALWIHFFAIKKIKERTIALRGALIAFAVLIVSTPSPWEKSKAAVKAEIKSPYPSFVLIGLDSVPGSLFRREGQSWKKQWQEHSVSFKNAYSVTNSTYTSWFSILSGKYPFETGVETLFPSKRYGNFPPDRLLPNLLKAKGYRTAFVTDCANTSFFNDDSGFDERYQPDRGVYKCYDAMESSRHVLARALPFLFPATESDCGTRSPSAPFWKELKNTVDRLAKEGGPYFVAAHTCSTSPESVVRNSRKSDTGSAEVREYRRALRKADQSLSEFLASSQAARENAWTVLFSDHGVRLDETSEGRTRLTHATGDPLGRYQYQVPLAFLPPKHFKEARRSEQDQLVALPSLYSTILDFAGTKVASESFASLRPVISGAKGKGETLILSSSLPSLSVTRELGPLLNRAEIDANGGVHLRENDEKDLLQNAPIAVLNWPYRTIFYGNGATAVFDDLLDPHNLEALGNAEMEKQTISEGKELLCAKYRRYPCSGPESPRRRLASGERDSVVN